MIQVVIEAQVAALDFFILQENHQTPRPDARARYQMPDARAAATRSNWTFTSHSIDLLIVQYFPAVRILVLRDFSDVNSEQ